MTQTKVDQAVITDPRIDDSAFMLEGIDTSSAPNFTVSEFTKFFFARTPHWMRWLEGEGALALDSQDIECRHVQEGEIPPGKKKPTETSLVVDGVCTKCQGRVVGQRRTESGARVYDLADVEEICHALAQHHKITGSQLHNALLLVAVSARVKGYIA